MRKIRLCGNDYELFGEDISGPQFDFFQKHQDTFKRMWTEQGKKFWSRFVEAFKIYTTRYGMLKEFPGKTDPYELYLDEVFDLIHTTFVEGRVNAAKNLVKDIVLVAHNRHMLQYLESKSYAKDPFYNRETRDVFRRLFGPKDKKSSYLKTYLLFPVYLKFGGSVARILRLWMNADDQDSSDETYWEPLDDEKTILAKQESNSETNSIIDVKPETDCSGDSASNLSVKKDLRPSAATKGSTVDTCQSTQASKMEDLGNRTKKPSKVEAKASKGNKKPKSKDSSAERKDNSSASKPSSQAERDATMKAKVREMRKLQLKIEMTTTPMTLPENIERVRNAAVVGTKLKHADIEELKKDTTSSPSYMELELFLCEKFDGDPRGPVFTPSWQFGDPRFNDPLNPLFDVFADPTEPWYEHLDYWKYRQFCTYVQGLDHQLLHALGITEVHELYLYISTERVLEIIEKMYKDNKSVSLDKINETLEDYPVNFIGSYNYCNICLLDNGEMKMVGYRPVRKLEALKPMEAFIKERMNKPKREMHYYEYPQLVEIYINRGEKEAWRKYQELEQDPTRPPSTRNTYILEHMERTIDMWKKIFKLDELEPNEKTETKTKEPNLGNDNEKGNSTIMKDNTAAETNIPKDVEITQANVSDDVKCEEANVSKAVLVNGSEDIKSTKSDPMKECATNETNIDKQTSEDVKCIQANVSEDDKSIEANVPEDVQIEENATNNSDNKDPVINDSTTGNNFDDLRENTANSTESNEPKESSSDSRDTSPETTEGARKKEKTSDTQNQNEAEPKKKKRKRKKKQRTTSETDSSVADIDKSPIFDMGNPGVYDRTKRDKCIFDHLVPKNSDGTPNSAEANKATEERLKADEESPLKTKMEIEPSEIYPFETDENCFPNVMHFEAEDGILELRLEEKGHDGFVRTDKKFDIVIKQWHPYSQKFKDVTTLGPCFCGDHRLRPREFYYKPSEHKDKWENRSQRENDMLRETKDLGLKEDVAKKIIANLPDNFDFGDENKRRNVASFSTDENKKKNKCSKCNVNLNIQLTDHHEGAEDRQNFTKEVQEIYNNNTKEPQVDLPKDIQNKLNQDNSRYNMKERLRKKLYEKQRDSGKDKGPEMQSFSNPNKPFIPPNMDPEELKKMKRLERNMERKAKEDAHAVMEKQRREIEYLEGKQRKRRQAEREQQKRDMEFEKQKQKSEMKKMFEKLDDDRQKYVELLKSSNSKEVPKPTLTIDINKYLELLKKTEEEDRQKVTEDQLPSSPPICPHKDRPQYHTCGHRCDGHHHGHTHKHKHGKKSKDIRDEDLPDEETMKRMVAYHKLHTEHPELVAQHRAANKTHHIYSDCSKSSGLRASTAEKEGTDDEPILPWCQTAKRIHEIHTEKEFLKKNPDLRSENKQTADYLIDLSATDQECTKKKTSKKDQKVAEAMDCQCNDCKRPESKPTARTVPGSVVDPKQSLHDSLSIMLHEAYSDRILTAPPKLEINMTPNRNPARNPLPHERTMGPTTSLYHDPTPEGPNSKQLVLGVKVREDNSLFIQPIEKTPGLDIHDSNTWPKLEDENVVDLNYHKEKMDQAKLETERKNLRNCSRCNMKEAKAKSFKKCSKCKSEGVKNAKYYCTRGCQVDDWKERHKEEHKNMNKIIELVD